MVYSTTAVPKKNSHCAQPPASCIQNTAPSAIAPAPMEPTRGHGLGLTR